LGREKKGRERKKRMLRYFEIPGLIDISCVRANTPYGEVEKVAKAARKFRFVCAFALPDATALLSEKLRGAETALGGVSGFPSGADTTEQKVFCAEYMMRLGCREIDMVINVGALLSGDDRKVRDDIRAVVEAVRPLPVKSILEVSHLDDEQITRACNLAVEAGVSFVKSGTGWAGPTTLHHVEVMKAAVGDRVKVKAAGGIRSLDTVEAFYEAGGRRFGIGIDSALKIMKEAYRREGVRFDEEL
jgi:deoxyribose-phosphate aldolase